MSNSQPRRLNGLFGSRTPKQRRPAGISRRRKKQFSFETLESRQVMSATSLVQPPAIYDYSTTSTSQSASSDTDAGQIAILASELYWQSLIAQANQATEAQVRSFVPPNDPLFSSQWHLLNMGQQVGNPDYQPIYGFAGEDINVAGAWGRGYTGAGVTVGVFDSGVQLNHPDLAANINLSLSRDFLAQSGNGNPVFNAPGTAHGTAVAGLIGAVANNGIGGTGVAPGVTLVAGRLIDFGQTEQAFIDAFRHATQEIDITNNSWGPPVPRLLAGPTANELLALRDSIIFGRGGLGVIHVFAAGNSAGTGFPNGFPSVGGLDSSAYDGWVNSRYTIAVTGVDHDGFYNNIDGTHTGYPETSSAVLVAAPTGSNAAIDIADDTGIGSGLWTTDLTGEFGYNIAPDPITGQEFDRDFLANTDYTSRFNGTSGAAPIATGVIALMLEANPNLSWRDVQEILVRSARMNAPTEIPSNGYEGGVPIDPTQSLWIVNQKPVFHDPDPYIANIPVPLQLRMFFPTSDPNMTTIGDDPTDPDFQVMHYQAQPLSMTNGAGYTVSQGKGTNGEMIGYGHGVVDAEMAVLMAEQWHTKGQNLPAERTFTTGIMTVGDEFPAPNGGHIPALEQGNTNTGGIIVPGGLGGAAGFIGFWNEYTAPAPFAAPGHGPENTRGMPLFLTVPDSQTMNIESVEVKISLSGGTAAAMDNLRILLVSPDGTHSELNHYYIAPPGGTFSIQNDSDADFILGGVGSIDNGGDWIWTFDTKRSWGERSDNTVVIDPFTGEPIVNTTGFASLTGEFPVGFSDELLGSAIKQGWQLHFENYGPVPFDLNALEVVWHGSPVQAESQRVQGFIGVDDNRDGAFNYSRMITEQLDLPGDLPNTNRYGELLATVDENIETFAKNQTVTVTRVSDGVVVDRFVTGHDGNFYFDLVPDEYIISVEDPEGRETLDDTATVSGQLRHYQSEWHITEDWFKAWDKVTGSPTETVVDVNGTPLAWLDGNGDEVAMGIKGINFLLDPGEVAPEEANFSGTVYADTNGDGVFNGNDFVLSNVTVYGDVNRNGAFDSGESTAVTDANGNYTLLLTEVTSPGIINVGVVAPTNWTVTNPVGGVHTQFVMPGNSFDNVNFFLDPPTDNIGGGGATVPGILAGVVYEDLNNNGVRNTGDRGLSGYTVYLDANNNSTVDVGEASTLTNQFGAYSFTNVAPGVQIVRIIVSSPLVQTTPLGNGGAQVVTLTGSSSITSLNFGVFDSAFLDFGDLPTELNGSPTSYDTRPVQGSTPVYDPARHTKGQYWLGASVDSELGAYDTLGANGDDNTGAAGDDENGITFDPIIANGTLRIVATANRFNGYLQGWIDWNNDGDFADANERVVMDELLEEGENEVFINVPTSIAASSVYARFRYGEHSHDPVSGAARAINTPWGRATIGEVEDYLLPVADQGSPLVAGIPADFDSDDDVDGSDFLTWQRNLGMAHGATQAQGSANGDGAVTSTDLIAWGGQFGQTPSTAAGSTATVSAAATTGMGGSLAPTNSAALKADVPFSGRVPAAVKSWIASLSTAAGESGALHRGDHGSFRAIIASHLAENRAELRTAVRELAAQHGVDLGSLPKDVAFSDLAGRHGLKSLVDAEAAEDADCDEAFAELAVQSIW